MDTNHTNSLPGDPGLPPGVSESDLEGEQEWDAQLRREDELGEIRASLDADRKAGIL